MYKAMFRIYIILMQILLPLWSVSVDPHNFADSKHWYKDKYYIPWDFFCYELHLLAYWTRKPYSGIYNWSCSRWCRDILRISPLQRRLSSTDGSCKFFSKNFLFKFLMIVQFFLFQLSYLINYFFLIVLMFLSNKINQDSLLLWTDLRMDW